MNDPLERRSSGSEERHTFVCAWCNVLLRSSPDPASTTVNYGICPQCLESQLKALAPVDGARASGLHRPSPRANGVTHSSHLAAIGGSTAD
jgi:hypothetical protein